MPPRRNFRLRKGHMIFKYTENNRGRFIYYRGSGKRFARALNSYGGSNQAIGYDSSSESSDSSSSESDSPD